MCRNIYKVRIDSIHPYLVRGTWSIIFTTSDSQYNSDTETVKYDIETSDCNDNAYLILLVVIRRDVKVEVCYKIVIAEQSVNIYIPTIDTTILYRCLGINIQHNTTSIIPSHIHPQYPQYRTNHGHTSRDFPNISSCYHRVCRNRSNNNGTWENSRNY